MISDKSACRGLASFLKNIFSYTRSDWAIRLLKLSRLETPSFKRGLVMLQIDGLSLTQLQRALNKGQMPFLNSLIQKERYVLHSFYSGMPSNTPAVQGEIFYGVKTCVPAFCFMDKNSGRTIRMNQTPYVHKVEQLLKTQGKGLLEGGSSYSNIYSGGASEAHFCFSQMGWSGLWHAGNPLVFPLLFFLYIDIFIRTIFLLIAEFAIALFECIRGALNGKPFRYELEFVFLRVIVCIFLREFCVAGASMDIKRGLPVIHVNFLGYDEQAHCRGPSSAYAHWSLRGIDDAIRRIYNVIRKSHNRDYDLWIYSDHGQEKMTPFMTYAGQDLRDAVKSLFEAKDVAADIAALYSRDQVREIRKLYKKTISFEPFTEESSDSSDVVVTAMGPVGHVYIKRSLSDSEKDAYAQRMVDELKIPLVLRKDADGQVRAWTPNGEFVLPRDAKSVFGDDHPFIDEIGQDVQNMCGHPDAGDWIICGWSAGQEPITFPFENGGHAGAGTDETKGFALFPLDAPLEPNPKTYLRPIDVRNAARNFMSRDSYFHFMPSSSGLDVKKTLRLMTYNVHGCKGMDGVISTERIARIIARYNPDVVALQELDVGRTRSGSVDQAEKIARQLEMSLHFHTTFRHKDEQYGNAILSRHPMGLIKKDALPQLFLRDLIYEPRGAIWVVVEYQGVKINVVNTHLSLWAKERWMQVDALLGQEWLSHPDRIGPTIFCGDFNMTPKSPQYRKICEFFKDSQCLVGHRPHQTWVFAGYAFRQIDHVFITPDFDVKGIRVPQRASDRIASDHLPLIVELSLLSENISKFR